MVLTNVAVSSLGDSTYAQSKAPFDEDNHKLRHPYMSLINGLLKDCDFSSLNVLLFRSDTILTEMIKRF